MGGYVGAPFVGIDLHRKRTVLEATYGWYWAVGALQAAGAHVHLAHPLGAKALSYRRVKNDVHDATDLADLLRMGRLPEAWIAPPATRELRELVRHRAKLVALRSHAKAEIHAVLAKCGVSVPMSDLFGLEGNQLLDGLHLPAPFAARVSSLRRVIDAEQFEIDVFAGLIRARLAGDPGYGAVQKIPGIGPVLGAVLVAEIGDITRFDRPEPAVLLGRADPDPPRVRHPRAPRTDHQAGLQPGALGRDRVRADPAPGLRRSARSGSASPPGAGATSPPSQRPDASWSTSTGRCATTTCAPWTAPGRPHEHPPDLGRRRSCRS